MKHIHACSLSPARAQCDCYPYNGQDNSVQKQSVGPFTFFHASGSVGGTLQFNSFGIFKNA